MSNNGVTWKPGRGRSRSLKMAPFDRPYATFYRSALGHCTYSSILYHFRVFLTLNNIMTLKSELEVSVSLKLVPFESLGAVSYLPSIMTAAVSAAVCEILSVKEWCDLEN